MNKKLLYFVIAWIVGVLAINGMFFAFSRNSLVGYYWPGYIASMCSFVILLICGIVVFKQDTTKKAVYNAPLITISYAGLVSTITISIFYATRQYLANWIGIVVLIAIVAITVIKVLGAKAGADIIVSQENKVAVQTGTIKSATSTAELLMKQTSDPELKGLCKKVYEAFRFTDPVSNSATQAIDSQILGQLNHFRSAIENNDYQDAKDISDTIVNAVEERAALIKSSK